jgi:formylglycine-generating enzyme
MKRAFSAVFLAAFLAGCGSIVGNRGEVSRTTGWSYNEAENGDVPYATEYQQEAGPGLVYVEGGTFTMGRVEEDVMYDWNNHPRRVTVASFYMDETEVSNQDYREYLHWIKRVYPGNVSKLNEALPDTTIWREKLAYNEPYIENYLRHPAYSDYPVVNVSWTQATHYCKWRTDRVNEQILVDRGIISHDLTQSGQNVFTTEAYLAGLYQATDGKTSLKNADGSPRAARWEDGFMLPEYRLPTEAEWEYAALALIGNTENELLTNRKIYPWNGTYLREDSKKGKGQMKANYARGRGDYMGMAGDLNDNADIAAPIYSYDPNDYGLYCMSGNVNEWVFDVYRPLSFTDVNEFQPARGIVNAEYLRDENGNLVRNEYGELIQDTVADYRNYRDGDLNSQIIDGIRWTNAEDKGTESMYLQEGAEDISSLIDDQSRVYKGGSYKDGPYWLIPGTRRFLDQHAAQNDLGFRCAMHHVGSPEGL